MSDSNITVKEYNKFDPDLGTHITNSSKARTTEVEALKRRIDDNQAYWRAVYQVAHEEGDVWCSGCREWHAEKAFTQDTSHTSGYRRYCKAYEARQARQRRLANAVQQGRTLRSYRRQR